MCRLPGSRTKDGVVADLAHGHYATRQTEGQVNSLNQNEERKEE